MSAHCKANAHALSLRPQFGDNYLEGWKEFLANYRRPPLLESSGKSCSLPMLDHIPSHHSHCELHAVLYPPQYACLMRMSWCCACRLGLWDESLRPNVDQTPLSTHLVCKGVALCG